VVAECGEGGVPGVPLVARISATLLGVEGGCSSADSRMLARGNLEMPFLVGRDCATTVSISDAVLATARVLVLGDRMGLLEFAESMPVAIERGASEACEAVVLGFEL